MIEGFKVFVTGKELREHLTKQIAWHKERAEWYDKNNAEFQKTPIAQNISKDAVKDLQSAAEKHRARVTLFQFYVNHIPEDEKYVLTPHETDNLELTEKASRNY